MSEHDHEFSLCLTHDVDRPYKTWAHALFYTAIERDPSHLGALRPEANPYWQFDRIARIEDDLGVRSAFYFLSEPPLSSKSAAQLRDWNEWVQLLFRYDLTEPDLAQAMWNLADGGWEVGLHGSYHSYDDRERLAHEKGRIERTLGEEIAGGRQHYLNLDPPASWRHHRAIGLDYDASLGADTYGFQHGYDVQRPFDDEFAVFPLTFMETDLPDPGDSFAEAWAVCEQLLDEAAANDAVMTVLWHPRYFASEEFPGHTRLYRRLIERAQEMGAWVGSPGAYYEQYLSGDRGSTTTPHARGQKRESDAPDGSRTP